MYRLVAIAGLLAICISASGCIAVAAAAGAGTVAYVRGESSIYVDSDVQTVFKAADESLRELGMLVLSARHDALIGELTARDARDRKITVKIDGTDRSAVKISVRVGILGDEKASARILEDIRKRF